MTVAGVIDKERLYNVCKVGQGAACCRYISASKDGICCEKFTGLGRMIDLRVHEMTAKGDNCEGLQ